MDGRAKYDLTQGGILSKMLMVAVPIMGTQFMQMMYNLTDMFWLGKLSSGAVAASGTGGLFLWLSMAFMLIGRMGSEIGVSQSIGQKDEDSAKAYSRNALYISVILGTCYAVVMIAGSKPLIGFFNIPDPSVAKDASTYLSLVSISIPMTYISATITGIFNGAGKSKLAFYANAIGLATNMVLDPFMILVLGWGIEGAAIATAIAQSLVCVLFILSFKYNKNRPFERFKSFTKPDYAKIRKILEWSVPVGLESLLFTLLAMIVSRFIASFGSDAMTVQRIGSQVESLSWLIGGGFGSAITAFVGQNYGAGQWSRIHKGFRIGMLTMVIWGIVISLLLFFGRRILFGIFLPDHNIIEMGARYLAILAICQLPACMDAVAAGMFRGIGRTIPPSAASITSNVLRVPLVYILSRTSLGLDGIWLGVTISSLIRSVWLLIWAALMLRKQKIN